MATGTKFCLLGPLTVCRNGVPVPVPQGKLRVVLAVLLLNAGRVVSLDDLAEALWGTAPPRTARVTMQNYVMRLRKALGEADDGRITTHPYGYSITVDADELDVTRFCVHLDAADAAARAESWASAAAEAGEALSLCQGEPLADVSSDLLSARDVPRLAEMRLRALETRIDADLHLGRHGEVIPELRQLVSVYPLRERMHAQLMLALYRDGRQAEALTVYQHSRQILIDELGTEPGPGLRELQHRILTADPALDLPGAAVTAAGATGPSPYRGLSAFRERDAELFFGRESATAQVLELMSARVDGAGLVVVSGVSGVGKSSLLCAGVLSGLGKTGLAAAPEAASWARLVLTPGRAPLAELAVRLGPLIGADAATVRRRLTADPGDFALLARQAALSGAGGVPDDEHRRVLLVVDQCEQLFTLCEDAEERRAFIAALHAAAVGGAGQGRPAALAVLVVRADFEARLAEYPQLSAAVQDRFLLTAMTERQLRLAITEPAAAAGARVDGELVRVLLDEVRTRVTGAGAAGEHPRAIGAGVLPLLSHALDQAWRARTGETLTLADYERTGGIEGAVATSAQRAYNGLTQAQQETARQVFTRLTATSADGTDTAARASRAELTAGLDDERARNVAVVLETFAADRLLTLDADAVEISHEALLTAWPLLRDTWLADARADRVTQTRLRATAQEWALASRDPSYLYRGSRLDAAASTAARISADPRHAPLSQAEKDFLHASRRASRRRTRTRQQLTALLLALVAALAVVWIVALRAGQAATSQRDIADSRLLISESEATGETNATVSQLESIAAWSLNPSPQARAAMVAAAASPETETVTTEADEVDSLAFSRDGKILATGSSQGAMQVWNVAAGREIGNPQGTGLGECAVLGLIAGGRALATYADGTVRLSDVTNGRPIGRPFTVDPADHKGSDSVVLSADGRTLAVLSNSTGVPRLWNVAAGRPEGGPVHLRTALSVLSILAISRNGSTLATSESNLGNAGTTNQNLVPVEAVQIWDAATGREIGRQILDSNQITAAAFSPDGTILATGDTGGRVQLWNAASGRQIGGTLTGSGSTAASAAPFDIAGASAEVHALAFSPDGDILAAGGTDGTLRLWDTATGQPAGESLATGTSIAAIVFSPDGKAIATGNDDGTARVWNVAAATFRQIGGSAGETYSTTWAAFGPDGRTLATYSDAARVWDTATGKQIGRPFAANINDATDAALSPDGETLAIGTDNQSGDGGVQLWDVATGRPASRPIPVPGAADLVVFTPHGAMLATVNENGVVQLWNTATGRPVGRPLPVSGTTSSVAFLPDGTMLAARKDSGPVRRWDTATGKQIGRAFAGQPGDIDWLTLSPDGKTLAIADQNDTVRLWDAATGEQISSMSGLTSSDPVVFSPDGAVLATVDANDAVQLWDVATGQRIGNSMGGTGSGAAVFGPGQVRAAFSPDGGTMAIVNSDGSVQLWNVSYLTDPLAQLCARIGGSITPAEWAKYVPAGPAYRNACA